MERKLKNGDYVPDGNGSFAALSGTEEMLARVLFKLTARRGGLPMLPDLGSRLYQLGREKPSRRPALAAQYAAQALQGEDVSVERVELDEGAEPTRLTVYLTWRGEGHSVTLTV